MHKTVLVDSSDLLYHAQSIDYKWNDACDILQELFDMANTEIRKVEIYLSDLQETTFGEDCKKIIMTFANKNGLDDFTFVL